ncbi:MAG: hypothetical protein E6G00_08760 [Actinobacteria bacterium]|nr:MAG: hypothetical protein E6G00_08760 [Actinomycetota bacterium]
MAYVRVENTGGATASDLRLRLMIPEGLLRAPESPSITAPPEPPVFERRSLISPTSFDVTRAGIDVPSVEKPLGAMEGPRWVREGDRLVAEFALRALPHDVPKVSQHPVRFIAARPGRYEINWRLHARELREPSQGILVVEARPQPREDVPITTLAELIASADVSIEGS